MSGQMDRKDVLKQKLAVLREEHRDLGNYRLIRVFDARTGSRCQHHKSVLSWEVSRTGQP